MFLVAALLHDLGHWPFCHPIEDLRLPSVPHHELFANSFLLEGEIADVLREEWNINPRDVVSLLSEKPRDTRSRILASMLSGPIDIDKMDYLQRDSLHAGVPYGRHFDQQRLIGSLCLNEAGDGLAITDKGKTAAEMMVFARYIMFSEVYWHHAVRSATAMLQRAFFLLHEALDLDAVFRLTDEAMIGQLRSAAGEGPAGELLDGLFGPTRRLYKRLGSVQFFSGARFIRSTGSAALRLAGAMCRAIRHGGQHGAGPADRPARSAVRRPADETRNRIQCRNLFPQGTPLPSAGRSFAGGANADHRAIRRLREACSHFRPHPIGRRLTAVAEAIGFGFAGNFPNGITAAADSDAAINKNR